MSLNQIEEIQKLYAKPKTYKIPKNPVDGKEQVEIKIMPLGLEDMDLMNIKDDSPLDKISKNVKALWGVSLGISEGEAAKISLEFMKDMMDAFMDANNFKEEDVKKTGIKDFIKQKQAQAKEKEDEGKESNRKA